MQEIEITKKIEILFENEIVLYGTGSYGLKMLELLTSIGCNVIAFCDSNAEKWETVYKGLKIISKNTLKNKMINENIIVVISSTYFSEIIRELEKEHFSFKKIYSGLAVQLSIFYNINSLYINEQSRTKYKMYLEIKKEFVNDNIVFYMKKKLFEDIKKLYEENAIMIYQVGKVASLSIQQSLEDIGIPAIQLHSLQGYIYETQRYQYFFNQVFKNNKNIKIITLVREPIKRDISAFFQRGIEIEKGYLKRDLQTDFENMFCNYLLEDKPYKGVILQNKHKDILERCRENKRYGYTFDWFDCEIKKIFNIDVLEYPFNKERGYTIIREHNVEILVMQMEKINELENVIGKFVGNNSFNLHNKNQASNKEYMYLYKEFLDKVKLKKEYIDFYYNNNKAMEHFYSVEDREHFKKKWEDKIIKKE